jgi:hypothetical protein
MPNVTHLEAVPAISKAEFIEVESTVAIKRYLGVCNVLDIFNEGILS